MGRTRIDWATHTINPVKGYCPVACPYCYARRFYDRYGWDKTIRFDPSTLKAPRKPGARIFIGSTIELFGPWVKPEWIVEILAFVRAHPEHTFIFLSKRLWELPKFNPWPRNAWVGTTADIMARQYLEDLANVSAPLRFVSFEPLLEYTPPDLRYAGWVIIGAQTGPGAIKPELSWVLDIIKAADEAKAKVFLKDNLLGIYPELPRRQELPDALSADAGRDR